MKKKKAGMKKVNKMMVSIFSLQQKQIVEQEPPVAEVKTQWPALFTEQQATDTEDSMAREMNVGILLMKGSS
uniref:Uncharacterized protein n=2 Tax=Anguilla anguilla TaxID=7936 RepID=A0A0E9WQ15_ANGAN